jgi:hypothetical protein
MQPPKEAIRRKHFKENILEWTPQGLASWWLGVQRNNKTMNLRAIADLLGGKTVHFKTLDAHARLQIDLSHYPGSLPEAVGNALHRLHRIQPSARLFIEEVETTRILLTALSAHHTLSA